MKLKDLKVGDKIIVPHYDALPCTVTRVEKDDAYQPVYVEWEDGTATWPEPKYPFIMVE